MSSSDAIVQRGITDFEGRSLVGTFHPSPETLSHHGTPMGLGLDGTYLFATVRDDEGNMTSMVRRIGEGGDSVGLSLLHSPVTGTDFRVDPEIAASAFIGRVRQEIDSEKARFFGGKAYPHGDRVFGLTVTPTELHWSEGPHADLTGRIIGPGLKFFTPWSEGGVLYISRLWEISGTVRGREVTGFMGLDNAFTSPGYSWGHEPVSGNYELTWYTWGNRYEDGAVQMGRISSGNGHWGFAIFNNEGGVLARSTDVRSLVTKRDEIGWPLHISYWIDGEEWEWVAEERGRMVDLGLPGQRRTPNSEGQFRRVGEERAITSWMAWGETVPENGDERKPAPAV